MSRNTEDVQEHREYTGNPGRIRCPGTQRIHWEPRGGTQRIHWEPRENKMFRNTENTLGNPEDVQEHREYTGEPRENKMSRNTENTLGNPGRIRCSGTQRIHWEPRRCSGAQRIHWGTQGE